MSIETQRNIEKAGLYGALGVLLFVLATSFLALIN
jgi:hypothetical protein